MDMHDQISSDHFGFRIGKSTLDAVVSLADTVMEGLEYRHQIVGLFLNLFKATHKAALTIDTA